ncbi:MAG: hypothetical protein HOI07_12350 [Betaproteobacteria bacterium]|jgi:hypothetical protein|nr:hypothetical protein [Betaproteobacteria bacterium]
MSGVQVDYKLIGITTILGVIYTAIASVGIKRFNECKEIQGISKYANRKMFLSHTLTGLLAIPIAFIVLKFGSVTPNATGFMVMLSGVLGIIASVFAFQIQKAAECTKTAKTSDKNFTIFAITAAVLMTLGGIGMIAMTNKDKLLAARNYAKSKYNAMRAPAPAPVANASATNLTNTNTRP